MSSSPILPLCIILLAARELRGAAELRVCAFNLHNFGESKARNGDVMDLLTRVRRGWIMWPVWQHRLRLQAGCLVCFSLADYLSLRRYSDSGSERQQAEGCAAAHPAPQQQQVTHLRRPGCSRADSHVSVSLTCRSACVSAPPLAVCTSTWPAGGWGAPTPTGSNMSSSTGEWWRVM